MFLRGYLYAIVLTAIFLAGCSTTASRDPGEEYDAVLNASSPTASNDSQALEYANILQLQPGKVFTTEITPDDPKLQHNKITSNYKVFVIQGVKGAQYTLELRALCDCWGINKLMPYPIARILDGRGNTINDIPGSLLLSNPDWNYPVNIHVVWQGEFEESDDYYFLVTTYNQDVGTAYLTYEEFNFLAKQVQNIPLFSAYLELVRKASNRTSRDPSMHPLWSAPAGKIVVTLTVDSAESDN